jgi:putative heme-binding domain-containing protein
MNFSLLRSSLLLVSIHAFTYAQPQPSENHSPREYRDFTNSHDGNPADGKELFFSDRLSCTKCHTIDQSSAKAGPDLYAVGDKFPRRELIQAILEPSANIAIGYGSTRVETKDGDNVLGIIKNDTDSSIDLMTADGQKVTVSKRNIQSQQGSTISLMPEGLQAGLTREEFADLIAYLTTLRQPQNQSSSVQGMPGEIRPLAKSIELRPFLSHELRFPGSYVFKPGDVRYGLVAFAEIPGRTINFLAAHQSGKIWLIEKNGSKDTISLFADFSSELFNERGPNGLLDITFHPDFVRNRKYYLKHQVFENGKIATTVVEKQASDDCLHDSRKPSRRILKIECVTQDHTGGCIQFGPDGYLYIGMGDTGPQQDPQGHGQNTQLLLGKILRIDVDRRDGDLPYAIPADNPFQNSTSVRPEIWAIGFREPWRFTFDSVTGDLWVGDVGQDRVEEVDIVRRGENYGWNVYEGFEPFSNKYRQEKGTYSKPVFAYRRKYGNSITGGYVYRGNKNSSFYGVYICGDYTSRRIWGIQQENGSLKKIRQIGTSPEAIASFATDSQGNLYLVGYEGMIYQLDLRSTSFEESPRVNSPKSKLIQK